MRPSYFGLASLLLFGFAACGGDDGNNENFDYDADEGGEVRVEYVRFAGGNAATRVTAFLYQDSGSMDYFPYLNLNGCTDVTPHQVWPLATNPEAERVYLDPGGVRISGGPMPLDVERSVAGVQDPFARVHPPNAAFFHFQGGMGTDGTTYLSPNTRLDVTFTGTEAFEEQTFEDVLYMPQDFPLTAPDTAPYALTDGVDHTFAWQVQAEAPPEGYEILSLVAFTGMAGPAVVCVEPNDGSVTVPANLVGVVRNAYASGGTLARQTLTHVTRELVVDGEKTGRRIDFLAVWCYATAFSVPAP